MHWCGDAVILRRRLILVCVTGMIPWRRRRQVVWLRKPRLLKRRRASCQHLHRIRDAARRPPSSFECLLATIVVGWGRRLHTRHVIPGLHRRRRCQWRPCCHHLHRRRHSARCSPPCPECLLRAILLVWRRWYDDVAEAVEVRGLGAASARVASPNGCVAYAVLLRWHGPFRRVGATKQRIRA